MSAALLIFVFTLSKNHVINVSMNSTQTPESELKSFCKTKTRVFSFLHDSDFTQRSQGVAKSRARLSDFTFTFHFHALEKEMATHSSVLAWRIPGSGEPGGLPSMGSNRVRHD